MFEPLSRANFIGLFNQTKRTLYAALAVLTVGACATQAPSTQQALQELCNKADLSNTKQRTLLAGGYQAIEKNDLVCAERLTNEARQKDPKDAYAALNLGAIYQRTGRIELARNEYKEAISLDGGEKNDSEKSEGAVIATLDQAKNKSPGDIAKRNLERLKK
jgi:Tfp pilus assembly protein PilF